MAGPNGISESPSGSQTPIVSPHPATPRPLRGGGTGRESARAGGVGRGGWGGVGGKSAGALTARKPHRAPSADLDASAAPASHQRVLLGSIAFLAQRKATDVLHDAMMMRFDHKGARTSIPQARPGDESARNKFTLLNSASSIRSRWVPV